MPFETLSENLEKSGKQGQAYIKNTVEYYKLRMFKTITKGAIPLVKSFILGVFALFGLLFFSIGAALWLGDVIDSKYLGYFIVGAFYVLIIFTIAVFGKKPLQKFLLIKFSDMFFDNDEDPEPSVSERLARENNINQEEDNEKV